MPRSATAPGGPPDLDDEIWNCLVDARDHDWTRQAQWRGALPGGELVLNRQGPWKTDITLDAGATALLDTLSPLITAECLSIAQLGQSLDGRIATPSGDSHYINGPVALTHLHRLRALVDAVVVGAGTACADRPRLNVRHVNGPDPVAVIIDPRGRVPVDGPLFEPEESERRVLHLVGSGIAAASAPKHVERVALEIREDGFAPADILAALEERGLRRILIEGGSHTVSRFLQAGALDRLHLLIAPLIIGSGRNGLELPAIDRLDEALRPRTRNYLLGDELLVDVDLRAI